MAKGFTLASLLGKGVSTSRLPDLGTRELSVLDVLWAHESLTCQATLELIGDQEISLSTVQSTLERLHRKELVQREKVGRSYVYRPVLTRENVISRLMHDIADYLADGDSEPMVSGFMDYLDNSDSKELPTAKSARGKR